ncbi:amino acid ABC transporter substrate-binding protein/signal transduction system [Cyanobium sp. Copco_Reservoir_LC18]|uniref:transporter substrate-binding domain-containing protein n=1 Tax=Cyanobium sp. Copco_Reservoir_LC18 TaxID=1328305 RepID=UPI0016A957D3|nr:transporter substrate-binding domain-containing protein [Cyanobium sp. Copco_Reservoir_LC18]KAF0654238.1 amino acid ABC transporter substrate-binding protein/signal transduction system [Cyanobium sp. Copco_Reservoir_LC18]
MVKRLPWALAAALALGLGAPGAATAAPVLRVGLVDGSPPCSYREAGVWRGLAIDLWNRVATLEEIPYVVSQWPSVRQMLEASREGRLDVAVGCINVSPDRVRRYRFSLPFQEDGLAVMVVKSRLDLGRSFLSALLTPTLLQLLGSYLLAIALLTGITLRLEVRHHPATDGRRNSLRHVSKVFQVLATGPGSNTIVTTTRGNGVVILAYLVRIVSASLLVGYLTVNVAGEIQDRASGDIRSPADLRGRRVGVRAGTVSESLLKELNATSTGPKATIVPLASIGEGGALLAERRIDALLGDNLQLSYLLLQEEAKGFLPSLALEGIRPESQAFAYAPALPEATANRIDQAISALKRSGVVSELRQQATTRGNPQAR